MARTGVRGGGGVIGGVVEWWRDGGGGGVPMSHVKLFGFSIIT